MEITTRKQKTGFISPADDFAEQKIDLNKEIIKQPASTFLVRVASDSMTKSGYYPGDILVVEKGKAAVNNSIIIANVNGEFAFRRLVKNSEGIYLTSDNPTFKPVKITDNLPLEIWGVVICSIHYPK